MGKGKKSTSKQNNPTIDDVDIEKQSKQLEDFQGFKVLPVIMSDTDKSVRHYLYLKKHESKSLVDENIRDRTLFLLNLPADTTDRHLKRLFKGCNIDQITYSDSGSSVSEEYWKIQEKVEQAKLEQQRIAAEASKNKKRKHPKKEERAEHDSQTQKLELRRLYTSGSSAHIVFSTDQDLQNVLNMRRVEKKWAKDDTEADQPLGLQRYVLAYNLSRPDAAELQREVDSFMMKFKADEYQKERERLERMNKMDEDGFTLVVSHKKAKTTDGTIHVGAITAEAAEAQREYYAQKKKKKELVNFYSFQMREKKQNELKDLRRKFEEDKAKIARLKQNRKFKPY